MLAGHHVVVRGREASEVGESRDVGAVPVAALGGVVVDDVEEHLHADLVEGVDHLLELAGGAAQ